MKKYVTGDVVIRQGTTAKAMFFVVKGLLKVISEDGEVDIGELSAGTYCICKLT
jgi:CRP-like cAMP-binding protein